MKRLYLLIALNIGLGNTAWADSHESCIKRATAQAEDHVTLGEIKLNCRQNPASYPRTVSKTSDEKDAEAPTPEFIDVDDKRELELQAAKNPYGISPHKRNYMMPITYSDRPNNQPFQNKNEKLDGAEVKFQFSYKVPLVQALMGKPIDFYFAYTNQSYWQAFNGTESRPFRETNHEPELFFSWTNPWFPGWARPWVPRWAEHAQYSAGISHQSNGQSGDLSRSWNRVFFSTLFQHRHYYLGLKVWDRLNDKPKEFPGDPRGDDNPDIEKFMGHFELELSRVKELRSLSILIRNNLRRDNNLGAFQIGYSFPLTRSLRGYMEYFRGYGESLIDYNHDNQRIGVGLAISDWP